MDNSPTIKTSLEEESEKFLTPFQTFIKYQTTRSMLLVSATVLALFIGKSAGITAFAWLALKLKIAYLPSGLDMRHVVGLAMLAGIGFTMSIFISNLAFKADAGLLLDAKAAILTGSFIAGCSGYLWLRYIHHDSGPESDSSSDHDI